jgi:hypothetical protein
MNLAAMLREPAREVLVLVHVDDAHRVTGAIQLCF